MRNLTPIASPAQLARQRLQVSDFEGTLKLALVGLDVAPQNSELLRIAPRTPHSSNNLSKLVGVDSSPEETKWGNRHGLHSRAVAIVFGEHEFHFVTVD